MSLDVMLMIAVIGLTGSLCQWFGWWVKLPSILFLLLAGFLLGPVGGVLNPDALFGDLLFPVVSLAVAVILFEGALTLDFREIRGQERVVRRLVTGGMLATWAITATAAHYLIGLHWELSALFGALVVVTGPTVIVPMLRILKLNRRIANILRWEGIVIDPVGATLAVLVFTFIVSNSGEDQGYSQVVLTFVNIVLAGCASGAIGGLLLHLVLKKHWLPEYLHNVFTLNLVFVVFALSDHLAHESGLLAVTVMGMWLANSKLHDIENILNFKESLTVFLISGLFILLAARMDLAQFQVLGWGALAVLLVIQFIARPVTVWLAALGSDLSWKERAMLAWIAPRGIVAAAVSALFALRLEQQGHAQASVIVALTFMVIIGTVVFQSLTAGWVGRRLGVSNPEARGILIIGANPVAIAIAKALNARGFDGLLADSNWKYIQNARMQDLRVYYGNPVSDHADQQLDLIGIGKLLALSMNRELNYLAAMRYQSEFGRANVYSLQNKEDAGGDSKHAVSPEARGRTLFGEDITYAKLASVLSRGGTIKATGLSEEFDMNDYLEMHGKAVIPLFAISPKGRQLRVLTGDLDEYKDIKAEWTVLSLFASPNETDKGTAQPQGDD